jgi:hypothetical protein
MIMPSTESTRVDLNSVLREIRRKGPPPTLKFSAEADTIGRAITVLRWASHKDRYPGLFADVRTLYWFSANLPKLPSWTDGGLTDFRNKLPRQNKRLIKEDKGSLYKNDVRLEDRGHPDGFREVPFYRYTYDDNDKLTHVVGPAKNQVRLAANRFQERHAIVDESKLSPENRAIYKTNDDLAGILKSPKILSLVEHIGITPRNMQLTKKK